MSTEPKIYFFGCYKSMGHFAYQPGGDSLYYNRRPDPFGRELDTGYAPKDPSEIQFRCKLTQFEGWTIIAFWDRTIDHRGKANSAFIAEGLHSFESILALAKKRFPELFVQRFKDKLTFAESEALRELPAQKRR